MWVRPLRTTKDVNQTMNSYCASNQQWFLDKVPGKQAGAKKAFLGFRAWSFQKLVTSCMMKLQLSVFACFSPSFPSSPVSKHKNNHHHCAGKDGNVFCKCSVKALRVPVSDWGSLDSVKCTRLLGLIMAIERAVMTSLWNTSGSSSFPSLLQLFRHCTALLNRDWSYTQIKIQ